MKRGWQLPVILISIIVLLLLATAFAFFVKRDDRLFIHDYIQQQKIVANGNIAQHRIMYYQRGNENKPVMIHVKQGGHITKGQPLYSYENLELVAKEAELKLKVENQLIALDQLEGQLKMKQDAYNRTHEEYTQAEINWLVNEYERQQNELKILKAQVDAANEAITNLTITSQIDGEVLDINTEQLEQFTNQTQAHPILTLGHGEMYIKGEVDRVTFDRLNKALPVSIKLDGKTIEGNITALERKIRDNEVHYEYKVSMPLHKRYDGTRVKVHIKYNRPDAIWLHRDYVRCKKQQTCHVQKYYGNDVNEERVSVKKRSGAYYLIVKGLSSADELKRYH